MSMLIPDVAADFSESASVTESHLNHRGGFSAILLL
jgi:hypothetical protein